MIDWSITSSGAEIELQGRLKCPLSTASFSGMVDRRGTGMTFESYWRALFNHYDVVVWRIRRVLVAAFRSYRSIRFSFICIALFTIDIQITSADHLAGSPRTNVITWPAYALYIWTPRVVRIGTASVQTVRLHWYRCIVSRCTVTPLPNVKWSIRRNKDKHRVKSKAVQLNLRLKGEWNTWNKRHSWLWSDTQALMQLKRK